jgi:SAM-dependent methyltransferase
MSWEFLKNKHTRKLASEFFRFKKAIPRSFLAMRYLRGEGLEIGALHNPVFTGPFVKVKYVDRMSLADLVGQYAELANLKLVDPEIIDDGEKLSKVTGGSQDFIIANHFIEHCEDPIRTLRNFSEKLRASGVLYLAVPDKRRTFDRKRESTSFSHLVRDFEEGAGWSRDGHFHDFVRNITLPVGANAEEIQVTIQDLKNRDYSIHFHVWTGPEFYEFLEKSIARYQLPLNILKMRSVLDENIFILQKN